MDKPSEGSVNKVAQPQDRSQSVQSGFIEGMSETERQAQTPTCDVELERLQRKVAEIMEAGYELAKSVLTCDAYLGGNVSQLKLLAGKARAIVNEVEGKSLPLPLAAAIASAEARARLEEARKWKPFKCFDVSHHPLRSQICKTCQRMARWEERITELEAAARTPDSTNGDDK